jgi:hypothetical protein
MTARGMTEVTLPDPNKRGATQGMGTQLVQKVRRSVASAKSATERSREFRQRRSSERLYNRADWQLFLDASTLPMMAGRQPRDLQRMILRELVDNALDVGAKVTATYNDKTKEYVVVDNGPGIDPGLVVRLFSINRPMVSSKSLRLPRRGALGNGLRVVAGGVAATGGSLVVESRGHRLALRVDDATGFTAVVSDEPIESIPGTTVHIRAGFDGTEHLYLKESIGFASEGTKYTGPSSAHWYSPRDFFRLLRALDDQRTTVGDLAEDFGVVLDDRRRAKDLTEDEAKAVLADLQTATKPVPPESIGRLGLGAFGSSHYGIKCTMVTIGGAQIPVCAEAWSWCTRSEERGFGDGSVTLFLNRSRSFAYISCEFSMERLNVEGYGVDLGVKTGKANYTVALAITTPHVEHSDSGKSPALYPFRGAISAAIEKAAKSAHRAMERPPGALMTLKAAAWQVMPEAYAAASANDDGPPLPVKARQVMYAARPAMLRLTGKDKFTDSYFTQDLLPDYQEEHPNETENWDVIYDARGGFREPHTGREIRVGTLEVRQLLGLRPSFGPAACVGRDEMFPTVGPQNRYRAILFCEEEGFDPLFKAARLEERFDIAVMPGKGMSVTAARMLLDEIAPYIDHVFVLHDFDCAGFSIAGTLTTSSRRYVFKNKVPMVDIGLRLDDVERLNLQSEPIPAWRSDEWTAREATLRRHGATDREVAFLKTRRVELNAMTARQIVDHIERHLAEHGVKKVVPDDDVLAQHARRVVEQELAVTAVEKLRPKICRRAAEMRLPADLRQQVEARLQRDPSQPWDAALAAIMEERLAATRRPRRTLDPGQADLFSPRR